MNLPSLYAVYCLPQDVANEKWFLAYRYLKAGGYRQHQNNWHSCSVQVNRGIWQHKSGKWEKLQPENSQVPGIKKICLPSVQLKDLKADKIWCRFSLFSCTSEKRSRCLLPETTVSPLHLQKRLMSALHTHFALTKTHLVKLTNFDNFTRSTKTGCNFLKCNHTTLLVVVMGAQHNPAPQKRDFMDVLYRSYFGLE